MSINYRTVVVDGICKPYIKPVTKTCFPDIQAGVESFTIKSGETKKIIVRYKYPFFEPGLLFATLYTKGNLTPEEDDKIFDISEAANNNGFMSL
jgi:hypothetical protein